ncbi:spermatogenesis-associated protein 21 [Tupaia chinensis]|uniref:spermatogenesis-associated protein 21 n=1 Tax=Tupaia chinensis TaxID=246437 RepID=UPI000FFC6C2F|nr:spermatogenesis-associated protein 21 [Tupaia chinensis]
MSTHLSWFKVEEALQAVSAYVGPGMMDTRNAQMDTEGRTTAPGVQPSPGPRTARKKAGVEPAIPGVSQVMFPDTAETGSGKQPSSAAGGPQEESGHREVYEEGPPDLRTQEQRPPMKSEVPAAPERLQQPGKGAEDQQRRQQNPGTAEGQPPKSCQGPKYQSPPGHQAANGSDTVQPTELPCTLDGCGHPLVGEAPNEAGSPHIRLQGALLEPGSGEQEEDSAQEQMPLTPVVTPEEKTASSFLPSTSRSKTPRERSEAMDTQPASRPSPPPGFMKCLLEVEEEEATHRRALKARTLTARKSSRILTSVPTSVPFGSSSPSLILTLPQTSFSAPPTVPLWARPPVPGPAPSPVGAVVQASMPDPALSVPMDPGWRRTEVLYLSDERSLSYAKARRNLMKLYQNWEERSEEHLTLKQEEAFRIYFEIFDGPGEVDAQSLENILLLVGFSVTPAQVEDALMSADVDGDGHVDFRDFLAVMTDTRRFFCSVEQNTLADMAPQNPHTLLFEILSLLVEMLALPEAALEEITNYYQKKLKEGTYRVREMESAIGQLRSRKKLHYNLQHTELEISERRVFRILNRLKPQNYATNLQSPYAQVPCIPLCPQLDKKMVRRKQGNHYVLDQCPPASLGPDIRSRFFQPGPQGSRENSSDGKKWLSSVPARMH